MKKWITLVMALLVLAAASPGALQLTPEERDALRASLSQRFDIVPLSDAVGLRPKGRMGDVRLIEVGDTISINGETVTGRELRDRVGADAEVILRLSYLDAAARRDVMAPLGAPQPPPPPAAPIERQTDRVDSAAPEAQSAPRQRASGDRVQIFGDIHVREDESLSGQAVAVMGSVRVDGEVGDQVVAVMGSVHLGPNAIVRGDIVSVGGRVHRAAGAQIRGDVTQVALGSGVVPQIHGLPVGVGPWFGGFWDGFGAVPRLIGSMFRLLLLALIAAVTLLVARGVVEGAAARVSDAPVHATLVGMLALLLAGPMLFLLAMLLIISIVGLPLLIAIPFVIFVLLLMALAGFSGTAYAIGQWARRRLGLMSGSPFLDVSLGVVVILLPLLVGRLVALAGWWSNPLALLFVMMGLGVEFIAWSAGFGAVLTNAFGRWQARRASRTMPPPSPEVVPPGGP